MHVTNRRTCGGFTLVELVLVIIIAGVLAAVAVPRMVDRSAFQTHGGANDVRTALRYAQRLAMAKNLEVCVTTSPIPDLTLSLSPVAGGVCGPAPVIRPDGGGNYVVTVPANITLTTTQTAFRFDAQGRPITTPPNTILAAPVNFTVGGTISIAVQPETGYVQ